MDPDNGTTQRGYRDITVSISIPCVNGLSTGPLSFGVSHDTYFHLHVSNYATLLDLV